jgi:predicted RNA-binding Zn-ribbon protein involved in translation (DUF1610 family)
MNKYGAIVCEDCEVEMEKKVIDGEEEFVCPECGKEKFKDEIQSL